MASPFLLDTNVFIQAKNTYYSFEICPGFWSSVLGRFKSGDLFSIERVRDELVHLKDELSEWVTNEVPDDFFREITEESVQQQYREIILWVNRNPQFQDTAKADFASGADGWLLAYAAVNSVAIVTQEQYKKDIRNRVPIPNVCMEFGIEYTDTFLMLKDLGIQFDWNEA